MANKDVFKMFGKGKSKGPATDMATLSAPESAEPNPWAGEVDFSVSEPMVEPPPSSTATSKEPTIAPKQKAAGTDLDAGFYRGKGGYAYMLDTSGDITIAESPRGGKGTVVTQDSPFYDLIVSELAGRPASGIPMGMKTSAPTAPPKAKVIGAADEMTAEQYMPVDGAVAAGLPDEMEVESVPPSGRASMAEKEAYADKLLGPVEKAGQYGSAKTTAPTASSAIMDTKGTGKLVEDAAQGLIRNGMSPQQAYKTVGEIQKQSGAEAILRNFASIKGPSGGSRPVSQSALEAGISASGRGSR